MPSHDELIRMACAQVAQVTILVAAVAILVRLAARNRPHLAHALWLVVLVKCVTPPVWSSPSGVFCWLSPRSGEISTPTGVGLSSEQDGTVEPRAVPGKAVVEIEVGLPPLDGESGTTVSASPSGGSMLDAVCSASVADVLLGVWALGAAGMLLVPSALWIVAVRRIVQARANVDESYGQLLVSLSRRFGIRRAPRLVATRCRVGPAVLGLVRPTVVLPEAVLAGKSAEELAPILAHELIHFRRGDLWVGVLQMIVKALWWFHPMVHAACRAVSLEAERCCDEAVVAELGGPPARYARLLLDVLQRKRTLFPVPAVPGVRPVEVTSKRLERIMRLGQGSRRRSPWWCWVVTVLAAAVVLPGAAMVAQEKDLPSDARPTPGASHPDDDTRSLPRTETVRPTTPDDGPTSQDDAARRARDAGLTWLLGQNKTAIPVTPPAGPTVAPVPADRGEKAAAATADPGKPVALIEARIISCPSELLGKLSLDRVMMAVAPPDADSPGETLQPEKIVESCPWPDASAIQGGRARTVIERDVPVVAAILDAHRTDEILARCQADKRANVLSAPTITVLDGQSAFVSDCSASPFVVAVSDGKPRVRTVREGLVIQVRPSFQKKDAIRLDIAITLSRLRNVKKVTAPDRANGTPTTLQIPEVETTEMATSAEVAEDKSLLLGGLNTTDRDGKDQSMLVLFRVMPKTARPAPPAPAAPPVENDLRLTVLYRVGNLVAEGDVTEADFEPLIGLITSTIAPDSWGGAPQGGIIRPMVDKRSILVMHTQAVHEQIVDLLVRLRSVQARAGGHAEDAVEALPSSIQR
ncbi:MAG: hypothetical protein JW809_17835 [Pirellulales bacterium]|nr:hypothetical protein [Pirellulales bacterium]